MEATAGVTAVSRGVSLPMSSPQPFRKEWRAVAEHSVRNITNEELERSQLGLSDERLIYEHGREPIDVDLCSITIDGNSDSDIMVQRLHDLVKQREELQQVEIAVRAKLISRAEMTKVHSAYGSQLKDHANANVKLQEQLLEKEQRILELERKLEEKERELHAIRLDNEAAWAKEDLLREQNKELQKYMRERDNSEAERAQHIKQIQDFQEHIQDKERQFMELQEQNRIAQETLLLKDEQLRETQAWMTHVQEMDALQSTTHHSLQAELRDRTEQCNQLWLGCQRQFGDMERMHMHIQQLQVELADAREKSGTYSVASSVSQPNSKDHSHIGESNGGQLDMGGNSTPQSSSHLSNGNTDIASFVSTENPSRQTEHVQGVPVAPTSFVGMPSFLPPAQMAALHPFVVHQQGVPHSVPPHVGQFHSVPAVSSLQHWHSQEDVREDKQQPTHDQHPESAMLGSDSSYGYESSVNGQIRHSEYLSVNVSQGMESLSVFPSSDVEGKKGSQPQASLQEISHFHETLRLDSLENTNSIKENVSLLEGQSLMEDGSRKTSDVVTLEPLASAVSQGTVAVGKSAEMALLEERALLSYIVRTIPPGSNGRIRMSSTLPNRLGKMIAPLRWHDYKRKYGKLEDFVGSHPELFVIEGDYIQLREGAQETIAATAAVAKVAAAAAAKSYSQQLPSVAVTPMAQSHRLKKAPSVDSSSGKADSSVSNQPFNGFGGSGGVSNIKILSKPKKNHHEERNGFENRSNQPVLLAAGNGANTEKNHFGGSQNVGSTHWSANVNVVGQQLSRTNGAGSS